jgi:hypothetical protein
MYQNISNHKRSEQNLFNPKRGKNDLFRLYAFGPVLPGSGKAAFEIDKKKDKNEQQLLVCSGG